MKTIKFTDFERYTKYLVITVLVLGLAFIIIAKIIYPDPPPPHQYTNAEVFEACRKDDVAVVTAALESKQYIIYPSTREEDGSTPLHIACTHGSKKVVALLLSSNRIDPNDIDIAGKTPLHRACAAGVLEVVVLLLADERVDLNTKNKKGRTPFQKACKLNEYEIAALMLASGRVNPNTVDIYGKTPLAWARRWGGRLAKLLENDPQVKDGEV